MRIPKYRLHKPSGRAVFQFKPLFDGKRIYLKGKFGSPESRAEYEKWRAKAIECLFGKESAPSPRSRYPTISEMIYAFLDWSADNHGQKEYDHHCKVARKVLEKYEHAKAAEFGPLMLKEVRQLMVAAGWSRTHTNHQVNRLRFAFKWGVENEWCDASVLANLKAVLPLRKGKTAARETMPVEPVSWSVASLLLPYVTPTIRAMIQVQYLTGMRSDELTALQGKWIAKGEGSWIYKPDEHKTAWRGKRKIICIGPQAKAILAPYLTDDQDAFVFSPAASIAEQKAARAATRKTKIYGNAANRQPKAVTFNERYDAHSYQAAINHGFRKWAASISSPKGAKKPKGVSLRDWLASFGISYWHPHQLRHTRGTLTRAAFGIEGAQAQLGNTLDATEIYAEKSLELALRIASETG